MCLVTLFLFSPTPIPQSKVEIQVRDVGLIFIEKIGANLALGTSSLRTKQPFYHDTSLSLLNLKIDKKERERERGKRTSTPESQHLIREDEVREKVLLHLD